MGKRSANADMIQCWQYPQAGMNYTNWFTIVSKTMEQKAHGWQRIVGLSEQWRMADYRRNQMFGLLGEPFNITHLVEYAYVQLALDRTIPESRGPPIMGTRRPTPLLTTGKPPRDTRHTTPSHRHQPSLRIVSTHMYLRNMPEMTYTKPNQTWME